MKVLIYFLAYIGATVAITVLLSYLVFLVIPHSLLAYSGWAQIRFHKLVHVVFLLVAVIGLWPLLKSLGVAARSDLGFGVSLRTFLKATGVGIIVGLAILASLVIVLVVFGVRVIDTHVLLYSPEFISIVVKALFSGLLVGLIEETLFRGAFFSVAGKVLNATGTILFTAFVYAAVHFIRPRIEIPVDQVGWFSGLTVLMDSFRSYWHLAFLDSFLALLGAGIFLGLVRFKTGHIGYCVGIHAGWVLSIKLTKQLTQRSYDSDLAFLVGYYDGIIGYLELGWLAVASLMYYFLYVRRVAVS